MVIKDDILMVDEESQGCLEISVSPSPSDDRFVS